MRNKAQSGQAVLDRLQFLLVHSGQANSKKRVFVFGQTPGAVTEVTVGLGGNVVLCYRSLTVKEMGGETPAVRRRSGKVAPIPCQKDSPDA